MKTIVSLILLLLPVSIFSQTFVKHSFKISEAENSESYQSFTQNGAWCWFSDPRAVYFEGKYKRTYAGWIDS